MAFFDVYVERAMDDSAGGRSVLAHRIAQRFGLEPDRVTELVSGGHFRVKHRVSDEIARRLGGELQALGAIVSLVDADTQPPATPDELAMSLRIRLDSVDATALVALDGSAGEKRELPADAFGPPESSVDMVEEDMVELAEPEVLAPRPMPLSMPPAPESQAPTPTLAAAPTAAPRPRTPVMTQSPSGQIALLGGRLRDKPVTHAAIGLVIALVLGFIPACLYTSHVRGHEIQPLRKEEVLLTHRPPEGTARTASDVRNGITSIQWREFFVCLGIWGMVGGAGAWTYFRLT